MNDLLAWVLLLIRISPREKMKQNLMRLRS